MACTAPFTLSSIFFTLAPRCSRQLQTTSLERHRAQPSTGRSKDGIGKSRRNRHRSHFTDSAEFCTGTFEKMRFNARRFVHANEVVLVKILLLRSTVRKG